MRPFVNAISYYLPEQRLTNAMINESHPEWDIDKIGLKTGINARPIAGVNEYASDMGVKAAEKLFAEYKVDRNKIDFLLFCTQSPDYFLPTTACIVQDRLSLSKKCGALDFNLGCSGFVYGLGLAKGLLLSGQAKNILLITSETYSKYIHPNDKGNRSLFGDAAAATLISIEASDSVSQTLGYIGDFIYGTDGSGAEHLIVKNGASRYKISENLAEENPEGPFRHNDYLFMDGRAIFEFTAFSIPKLVEEVLQKNAISREQVGLYVFHQANKYMLETIRKRSGIKEEEFFIHLADCANTVSSTIPIALHAAFLQEKIKNGTNVVITGFGVGLSLAGTILQFNKLD